MYLVEKEVIANVKFEMYMYMKRKKRNIKKNQKNTLSLISFSLSSTS